jgi:putative restriction endonuclease
VYKMLILAFLKVNKWYRGLTRERSNSVLKHFGEGIAIQFPLQMKLYVGITDGDWFSQLAALRPDEVNFWRPGGKGSFRALEPGELFLFKLHSPRDFIVGGGFFVSYSRLPISVAWLAFGEKNGVKDPLAFRERIHKYRRESLSPDPTIGCIILAEPFFLPQEQWIPVPDDWSSNIVQGKGYSTNEPLGRALWDEVRLRLEAPPAAWQAPPYQPSLLNTSPLVDQYGQPYLSRARLGQGAFRVLVTDAYSRRCAVTGEKTLPVLEAAHISTPSRDRTL